LSPDPHPPLTYPLSLHDALPIWSTATFGMPNTTQLSSSCASVCAPALRMASRPRAPSSPMPVISTPTAWLCTCSAQEWNSTSTRSEEHTSELQSRSDLVCRLLLE